MSDRKFWLPHVWSSRKQRKLASLFKCEIADIRVQDNMQNDLFLGLTKPLHPSNIGRLNVIINHTALEPTFKVDFSFSDLAQLSQDIVSVVVPSLQEKHDDYTGFRRFTPNAIDRLFKEVVKDDIFTIMIFIMFRFHFLAIDNKNLDNRDIVYNYQYYKFDSFDKFYFALGRHLVFYGRTF